MRLLIVELRLIVGLGFASHLGVLADLPAIGVAKTLFYLDGLTKQTVNKTVTDAWERGDMQVDLVGESGRTWATALRIEGACVCVCVWVCVRSYLPMPFSRRTGRHQNPNLC